MIKIRNLNKYYNRGKTNELHVIHDTTVTLPDTGLVCILGESGSGKTTFMNTVSGLDNFADGVIEVDGVEIKKFGEKKQEQTRNEKFGYIFQNYYLLMDRTVEYNIMLALTLYEIPEEEKERRIDYVLKAVDMWRYKKRLVSQLSGGQQQRVAIARALAKSPKVIFADEPTGNLDEANTMHIMGILKKMSKQCLVVVVTHEKAIAEFFADRILWISDGRIEREEEREGRSLYQYEDDGNLYLGEFSEKRIKNGNVSLSVYNNGEQPAVTVKLVYEQGKLYVSAGDSRNVEFLTKDSERQVIDSKRPMVEMKDVDEIAFELEPVENVKKPKMSFGEILDVAGTNIRMMGKKQIFLVLTLLIISILVTVSIQEILASGKVDIQSVVQSDTHYYKVSAQQKSAISQGDYRRYFGIVTEKLEEAGYTPTVIPQAELTYTYEGFSQLEDYSFPVEGYSFVTADQISEKDLISGRLPRDDNEVVLDEWLVENFRKSAPENESIITDVNQVVGNKISTSEGIELTVTGVSRTNQPDIYAKPELLIKLSRQYYTFLTEAEAADKFPDYQPLELGETEDGKIEVLVSRGILQEEYCRNLSDTYGELAQIVGKLRREGDVDYILEHYEDEDFVRFLDERTREVVQELKEAEESYGMTFQKYSELMHSDTEYLSYRYDGLITGNKRYQVVGYYEVDAGVNFIVPEEAVSYFKKALMDNNKECYIYGDDENVEREIQKIESLIPEEVNQNLVITVENEAYSQIQTYKEKNNEKFDARILIVIAIFVISLIILYFIMKANAIERMQDLGVYRMLGISKGSIIGIFACENLMITSYTSLIGVLLTWGITKGLSSMESLGLQVFYPWYALLLTVLFFYVVNILVGILPVQKMLRLPPAQLAAKYDI